MTDIPGSAAPTGSAAPPPPPPPGPPPVRRLAKSHRGRMFWGVAAGLGEYFDIDPLVFRIAFVVLAFTGGAGILLYVVASVLMPRDDGEPPPINHWVRRFERSRRSRTFVLILIVIAIGAIVSDTHGAHLGIIWGLALIALGALLFTVEPMQWRPAPSPAGPDASPPPSAAEPLPPYGPPAAPRDAPADAAAAATATGPGGAPPTWSTPSWGGGPGGPGGSAGAGWHGAQPWYPFPHRVGPPVGWITVALSLVALGVAVMLGNAGVISLTVGSALAIVLVVIGAGLLVSAFVGRGRWLLIVLGVLLLPFVGAGSLVDEPLGGGTGDRLFAPTSAQQVQPGYDIAAGRLTLDLSAAQLGSTPTTVRATVAVGELDVRLPSDLPVTITGRVGGGHMDLLGHQDDGLQIRGEVTSRGTVGVETASQSPLTLDLGVGLGQIRVERTDTTGATR